MAVMMDIFMRNALAETAMMHVFTRNLLPINSNDRCIHEESMTISQTFTFIQNGAFCVIDIINYRSQALAYKCIHGIICCQNA